MPPLLPSLSALLGTVALLTACAHKPAAEPIRFAETESPAKTGWVVDASAQGLQEGGDALRQELIDLLVRAGR